MQSYNLLNCITDEKLFVKFFEEKPFLLIKKEADYCLKASNSHLLYKYQDNEYVWYIHYNELGNIFKVCEYRREN